ncbi:hypothetical protein [Chryseobacterium sp. SL1]|uniref:hypothetical protein n=1 Tax=Chryseobacterium sp. SL1 TaxID=2995159 RepID=UPI0022730BB3|nr:hypothetical protein [Chryseobacterium sp. SL1]MCY1662597.1 hypothetical protein [Chryseobacterium sp. SL1]
MTRINWLLILLISSWYPAKDTKDTLQSWIAGFSQLANPTYSEDGRWVAVRKRYDLTQDTLLLVNTKEPEISVGSIDFNGETTFIKNGILVFGKSKAEFWNLKTNERKRYDPVKMANPLPETGRYTILEKNANLDVYDSDGKIVHHLQEVQEFPVSDKKGKLYVYRKNNKGYDIIDLSGKVMKVLRSTKNTVRKMELSNSAKYLVVDEIDESTSQSQIVLINTRSGKADTLPEITAGKDDYYKITEIQEGKAILVSLHSLQKPDLTLADIWYGTDENLKTRKTGVTKNRYWLWKSDISKVQELPTDIYPVFTSINSERYFLAFHPTKGHNYLSEEPQLRNVQVYDVLLNSYCKIEDLKGVNYGSTELICSYDGKYLLGSEDGIKWSLFEISSLRKNTITKTGLKNPVFTVDGRYIFFESPDDLWRYEIETEKLTALKIAPGRSTRIMNAGKSKIADKWNFSVNTIDNTKPLLIEVLDQYTTRTAYFIWMEGKKRKL